MRKSKKILPLIAAALALSVLLGGCGQAAASAPPGGEAAPSASAENTAPVAQAPVSFDMDLPEKQETTFEIRADAGGADCDPSANVYTISRAGEYDCYGDLFNGRLVVDADEDAEVVINLNGCMLTCGAAAPVSVLNAGKVEISAKKGTENKICDLRAAAADGDASGGAIDAACDLKLKGNGALTVLSGYNNGVHSRGDLSIQNLALTVMAPGNALKGNDSVTIGSGSVIAVSSAGDAVKTTDNGLSKKGKQHGTVSISGGTVALYAACDGIDSAFDADISGDAVVDIYTDAYSPYTAGGAAADRGGTIYLRVDAALAEAGYQYSAYFYNENGGGQWVDGEAVPAAFPAPGAGRPGLDGKAFDPGDLPPGGPDGENFDPGKFGPGGPGGEGFDPGDFDRGGRPDGKDGRPGDADGFGRGGLDSEGFDPDKFAPGGPGARYSDYAFTRPASFSNVVFYAYTPDQTPGQGEDYAALSGGDAAIPQGRDACTVSGIAGGKLLSAGWTVYDAASGSTKPDHSCKGIKAANAVTVSGGAVTVCAGDDGVHANFDETIASTGEAGLGNVTVTGGALTVSSGDDGIHADQDLTIGGGDVRVLTSYEALEGNRVFIRDGSVTVWARDDAVNANSKGAYPGLIEISGGFLDAAVPAGDTDTMDSNGSIAISGGLVLLKNGQMNGRSPTGGALDTDGGVTVTGGTVLAIGCIGSAIPGAASDTAQLFEAGEYAIRDAAGSTVAEFTLDAPYRAYQFYGDAFAAGQSYTVYQNGNELFRFTG